ncbi:VirK/YbjX family protein [Kluyvera genomosp. 1]|uniref:VirK/YbjX family protein n=1 Tax=Kluyvera genomosp. 1 TaxID=2774053 RepID=UPI00068E99DC|nr:VirK/YbjX family protein [Kluyvera genomosp. 1]
MSSVAELQLSSAPQPESSWQLFKLLTTGALKPGRAWKNPAYRRKFMLRTLGAPRMTSKLLASLTQQPQLMQILNVQPGLPCRLHRPWLSTHMSPQQTIDALCCHYQQMLDKLPVNIASSYLSANGAQLATIEGKEGQRYRIYLGADAMLDKEGEATLTFRDENNIVLAELTFTLCQYNGLSTFFIGGLQGAKADVPHQLIQVATKACHGLFPKRLVVDALLTVGEMLSVEHVRAVSNETHIYRSLRYRRKKRDKLHADYNSFWESLSATVDIEGDYILPLALPRKTMEEIASKKRAEYRRRYELLDALQQQVALTIQR